MNKTSLLLSGLFFLTACSSDEPEQAIQTPKQTSASAYKITPEQAAEIGNNYIAFLNDTPTTRSKRSVASIEVVRNDKGTRSDSSVPDTLLYVINYEDEQGFAIVSADARAFPVYAVSDTDVFEITETTNPSVIDFLENAKSDVIEKTAAGDTIVDVPIILPTIPVLPPLCETIKPLVSARQGRIGLFDRELCKYVVNDEGEPALTCCVPVALEIAMSYHKWPTSLEGYTFDWDAMNAGNDDDGIARMLAILSRRDYCHVIGNDINKIGAASSSNTIRSLRKMQYEITTNNPTFAEFGLEPANRTIVDLLKNNGPVLVRGDNTQPQHIGHGHIWVVDGLKQTFVYVMEGSYPKYEKYNMYHCIWGDYGRCNGYYLAEGNIFDGEPDSYDPIDSGEKEDYVFRGFDGLMFFGDFRAPK